MRTALNVFMDGSLENGHIFNVYVVTVPNTCLRGKNHRECSKRHDTPLSGQPLLWWAEPTAPQNADLQQT